MKSLSHKEKKVKCADSVMKQKFVTFFAHEVILNVRDVQTKIGNKSSHYRISVNRENTTIRIIYADTGYHEIHEGNEYNDVF